MSDINIFEAASQQKLRFDSRRGLISVEDLWDMPLSKNNGFNLDALAIRLHKIVNDQIETKSFVSSEFTTNPVDKLRFEVVKRIIEVKLAAQKKAEQAKELADKKQKIMAIIARKQDTALEETSLEDLQEMLNEL